MIEITINGVRYKLIPDVEVGSTLFPNSKQRDKMLNFAFKHIESICGKIKENEMDETVKTSDRQLAELRFVDGDYYIVQDELKVSIWDYFKLAPATYDVTLPDGTEITISNHGREVIMMAACYLRDLNLEK